MPRIQPSEPRRRARQRRGEVLLRAIQEAALEILEKEGPGKLTTNRIAERAGVSIGSVYYYYPNKEAILADVFAAVLDRLQAEIDALRQELRLQDLPPEEALSRYVHLGITYRTRLLRLDREFYRAFGHRFDLARHGSGASESNTAACTRWVGELIERNALIESHRDRDLVARLVVTVFDATLGSVVENDPDLLGDPAFSEELTRVLCGYLIEASRDRPRRGAARGLAPPLTLLGRIGEHPSSDGEAFLARADRERPS